MEETELYLSDSLKDAGYGSEWSIVAMARNGGGAKYGTYTTYYKQVVKPLKSAGGGFTVATMHQ